MFKIKVQNFWEKENIEELKPFLYSGPKEKCLDSVIYLKNLAIGSNRQKENVIQAGVIPRLLQLLVEETSDEQLLYEIGALLCTLSKGTNQHVRLMIDFNAIKILIEKITQPTTNRSIIEICLRTLRSLFTSNFAPINFIYENNFSGMPFIAYLLNMITKSNNNLFGDSVNESKSQLHNYSNITNDNWHIQECILNILASSCRTIEQQNLLCQYSCITTISDLLLCDSIRVSKAALNLLAYLCYENEKVSKIAIETKSKNVLNEEIELVELLFKLLEKNDTQLYVAKCFTNLFRANALNKEKKRNEVYIYKSMKVLIRLCKKENHPIDRANAADILSYLLELDSELQQIAAICDHLISNLTDFLTYNCDNCEKFNSKDYKNFHILKEHKKEDIENNMKESALKCFASLASTDEEIRKKISLVDSIMTITVNSLAEESTKIRLAALRCLHSLSRSVQFLQTSFKDHLVWIPLKTILLSTTDSNILSVASSTLCNLLLVFSPNKPNFLDRGTIEIICALIKKKEDFLRLNGVWALMNMSYKSDSGLRLQLINALGTDQFFTLIKDKESNIVLKTLGLIRNLLSDPYTDLIMETHGKHFVDIISMVFNDQLEIENNTIELKEQATLALSNIADGRSSKEYVISNDDFLKKLNQFLASDIIGLQKAAVSCITNLVFIENTGAKERQSKIRQMGIYSNLHKLLQTSDDALFDLVKSALQHFNEKSTNSN